MGRHPALCSGSKEVLPIGGEPRLRHVRCHATGFAIHASRDRTVDPLVGPLDLVLREPTPTAKVGPVMWKTVVSKERARMVDVYRLVFKRLRDGSSSK